MARAGGGSRPAEVEAVRGVGGLLCHWRRIWCRRQRLAGP